MVVQIAHLDRSIGGIIVHCATVAVPNESEPFLSRLRVSRVTRTQIHGRIMRLGDARGLQDLRSSLGGK